MLIVKGILRFLLKILVFAVVAGIFYTVSDYLWKAIVDSDAVMRENVFQRLGYYSLYTFVFLFFYGLFLLFILNDYLIKRNNKWRYFTPFVFLTLGFLLGYLSQGDGWQLYTGSGRRVKHILLLGLTLSAYPYVSYFIKQRFLKST